MYSVLGVINDIVSLQKVLAPGKYCLKNIPILLGTYKI